MPCRPRGSELPLCRCLWGSGRKSWEQPGRSSEFKRTFNRWGVTFSLADLVRLQEVEFTRICPANRAALAWLDRWRSAYDPVEAEWWRTFEQELKDNPVVFGRDE